MVDENTIRALVALDGAAIGALAAAGASIYASHRKIREIEVAYLYKIRDGYLENARKLSGEVYIPINIALTELSNAYDQFRAKIDFDTKSVPMDSQNHLVGACRRYLTNLDDPFCRGADAYLTTELDERLRRFNSFIRESQGAETFTFKNIFKVDASIAIFRMGSHSFQHRMDSQIALLTRLPRFFIRLGGGLSFGYYQQLLAAPLKSREFEEHFELDISIIKALIKEVTLGSHNSSTPR